MVQPRSVLWVIVFFSNMIMMEIDTAIYRARIGPHHCRHVKLKGLAKLDIFGYYTWLRFLLTTAGDIELNPGPVVGDSVNLTEVKALDYLKFF